MKYLFFDEESVGPQGSKARALSFGYILTDDKFNIICEGNYFFNPEFKKDEKIDWYAAKNIVKMEIKDIKAIKGNFEMYYKRIRKLMNNLDVICFGFQIDGDIKYLMNSISHYNLDLFNFSCVDVRKILFILIHQKSENLEKEYMKWCEKLPEDAHNSQYDAYMTMRLLQAISKKFNINMIEFLNENKIVCNVEDLYACSEEERKKILENYVV